MNSSFLFLDLTFSVFLHGFRFNDQHISFYVDMCACVEWGNGFYFGHMKKEKKNNELLYSIECGMNTYLTQHAFFKFIRKAQEKSDV